MRLNKYLTENDILKAIDAEIDRIKSECKPYLSLLKGNEPLMRGLRNGVNSQGHGQNTIRQNRQPQHPRGQLELVVNGRETPYWVLLNSWLSKEGFAERNKSISCTADYKQAAQWGTPIWTFPVGNIKVNTVPSYDFNVDSESWKPDELKYFLPHYFNKDEDKEPWGAISKIDPTRAIKETGFVEAYNNKYEIWIQAKKYYYVSCSFRGQAAGELITYFAKEMGFYHEVESSDYPFRRRGLI